MASGLYLHRHLLCIHSPNNNCLSFKFQALIRNPNCSARLKIVPKSSPRKHASSSLESERPPREPKSAASRAPVDPDPPPTSSLSQSSFSLVHRLRDGLKFDELGLEILTIALPAALALAADPIASLVDTAFVGHLGSVELAAVGVSVSVFNLVSKLFNVPLLNITTSFVAEEQALVSRASEDSTQIDNDGMGEHDGKKLLPSVSTSLALAASVGIAEAVALFLGSGFLMNVVGIPADSPMRVPAEHFLTLRAFGAPPIVIALAAQGTFRGFMDTKTPLYAIGGLLIGRTIAVLVTMTLATSMAAREGPIPMAGHQICVQVWLAVSLLTDALALAGQALLARGYSQGNYEQARQVIYRVLQIGLATGIALAVILFLGFGAFSSLFSTDLEVLTIAWSGILFVAGSQPMNALAFVVDGLYYGVSDFGYAAYSMVLVGLISSIFLLVAAPVFGLAGVWMGLFLFMVLRVGAGIWRLSSKSGPWKMVWSKMKQETD
ncbi:protein DETOXIFICATION 44, chloroplastic isoform X4 [Alnus glutinosa]|uniref:protein DETOXIFICATION 44, chloroplastic isoform X4 n=1 Tax=Alnus glutinosa TaxID=3517 RepID=UPI002D79566D|nr:protein DETOXIFICATION 44, chloroplastic isoform X4 [Alnus glutinosa]